MPIVSSQTLYATRTTSEPATPERWISLFTAALQVLAQQVEEGDWSAPWGDLDVITTVETDGLMRYDGRSMASTTTLRVSLSLRCVRTVR